MHLHSLAWLGAVVVVATLFYRRMFAAAWIAGLAALLFAVDDAHGFPAVWLANRNALIGVFFGLLTLIAHDRWRRDGWWMGAVLAPLAFLLGLLSKESAVATGAYLVAYALFLDRGRWAARRERTREQASAHQFDNCPFHFCLLPPSAVLDAITRLRLLPIDSPVCSLPSASYNAVWRSQTVSPTLPRRTHGQNTLAPPRYHKIEAIPTLQSETQYCYLPWRSSDRQQNCCSFQSLLP